ncbi:hypothetical protein KR018_006293 [Drosophila ironensis]|nr:hypothetical protein KR018_006293 [Drosophila ironensis]
MSSADSTLYFTAYDDMFKELLAMDAENGAESESETPKRCVRMRQQKLFAQESTNFVICRRSPNVEVGSDLAADVSPSRRRELLSDEMLRLRKDRVEKERQKPLRRQTLRI